MLSQAYKIADNTNLLHGLPNGSIHIVVIECKSHLGSQKVTVCKRAKEEISATDCSCKL